MAAYGFCLAESSNIGDANSQKYADDAHGHHELDERHTGLALAYLHLCIGVSIPFIMHKINIK